MEKEASVVSIANELAERNVSHAREKEANAAICVGEKEWIHVVKSVSFAKAEECKDVRCVKAVAGKGVPCAVAGEEVSALPVAVEALWNVSIVMDKDLSLAQNVTQKAKFLANVPLAKEMEK